VDTAIQVAVCRGGNPPQSQLEDDLNQVRAAVLFMRGDPKAFPARNVAKADSNGNR
jgi:hypothetical protein